MECKLATHVLRTSCVFLEYGGAKKGYWTGEKFIANVWDVAEITNFRYSSEQCTILWLFDQSNYHHAYREDALNTQKMNDHQGGAQPHMRDKTWAGKVQRMVDDNSVPKGMRRVLEERGINIAWMIADDMRVVLTNHSDFLEEKTMVER